MMARDCNGAIRNCIDDFENISINHFMVTITEKPILVNYTMAIHGILTNKESCWLEKTLKQMSGLDENITFYQMSWLNIITTWKCFMSLYSINLICYNDSKCIHRLNISVTIKTMD